VFCGSRCSAAVSARALLCFSSRSRESFGWDRAQVVSVYSLTALAGGLAAPLVGKLFDRSGPAPSIRFGLLLLGGAFLIAAHARELWQFN